jgi:glutathione S-transferase
MKLYYNPVSSFSMKALMAFYEKDIPFERSIVDLMNPAARAEYEKFYPIGKVPFLQVPEEDRVVPESSIIIEFLEQRHPNKGTKLIPADPELARLTRFRDRFADFNLNEPMQKIFFDTLRPADKKDPFGVAQAQKHLEAALSLLDRGMANKTWAVGDAFTMADCATAPCLFYCKKVHPFDKFKNVVAYAGRLMERPSFKKCLEEAMPILAKMA